MFDPKRAVEIRSLFFGTGYRIGGRVVLTAKHLLKPQIQTCKVCSRHNDPTVDFEELDAAILWRAPDADIALVALPETISRVDPVNFGILPNQSNPTPLEVKMFGYPKWAWTELDGETLFGGRTIPCEHRIGDISHQGYFVVEAKRIPEYPPFDDKGSLWDGISGAAVFCGDLLVAVQRQHQNPQRAASLEAELTSKVYEDRIWRQLLAEHQIPTTPKAVSISIDVNRAKNETHQIPEKALKMNAPHLPMLDTKFYFPLSVGVDDNFSSPSESTTPRELSVYSHNGRDNRNVSYQVQPGAEFFKELLNKNENKIYVVSGDPGSGKSTLLKYLTRSYHEAYLADNTLPLPLYVPLREYQGKNIRQLGLDWYFEENPIWRYGISVEPFLDGSKAAIWLLDGWDELEDDQKRDWEILLKSIRNPILLSCRIAQYQNEFGKSHLLLGLNQEQQERFTEMAMQSLNIQSEHEPQVFHTLSSNDVFKQIRDDVNLRTLASNPMLLDLTIKVLIGRNYQNNSIKNIADFYEAAFDDLIKRRLKKFDIASSERIRNLLLKVAEWMQLNPVLSHDTITNLFSTEFELSDLDELLRIGVLKRKGKVYEFNHLTFQEYFLAKGLYKKKGLVQAVHKYWTDRRFEKTLSLTWALAQADEQLVTTNLLGDAECESEEVERIGYVEHRKRDPLRLAFHLWHMSGVEIDQHNLDNLMRILNSAVTHPEARKMLIAKDRYAPRQVLEQIAKNAPWEVGQVVAQNPNAASVSSRAYLLKIAGNKSPDDKVPDWAIRQTLSGEGFSLLSNDKEIPNRESSDASALSLVSDPDASEDTLLKLVEIYKKPLASQRDKQLGIAIAQHPKATKRVLRHLGDCRDYYHSSETPEYWVLVAVAQNPLTEGDVLEKLSRLPGPSMSQGSDRRMYSRGELAEAVLHNPSIPQNVLLEKGEAFGGFGNRPYWHLISGNPAASSEMLKKFGEPLYHPNSTRESLVSQVKNGTFKELELLALNPNICLSWF